jgi:hypothetical protein
VVESEGFRRCVTVLSLSEGGFYCEGFDLDRIGPVFRLRLVLDPRGPAWSPTPGAGCWRSRMLDGLDSERLELTSKLLYLDLHGEPVAPDRKVGLGARFESLAALALDRLREFVARESFRAREWRVAGGAVPLPRRPPVVNGGDEI